MSKSKKAGMPRSPVAAAMIILYGAPNDRKGAGHCAFRDRRKRRPKDARRKRAEMHED